VRGKMNLNKIKEKYNITHTTQPSKRQYTEEEVENNINKALKLIINELIISGELKVGNS
jgi:hypothetical protein